MRGILSLIAILPLTGCLVGASQGRSSTSVVRDTGVPGVERMTVTSSHSGTSFGASMPMMMPGGMGYGYGYGNAVTVTGPSCVLHPDSCAVIQTATVIQPTTVVSYGGGGSVGGGSGVETVSDPELDAFLAKHEKAISALTGQHRQSVRQTCQILIANPEVIKDPAERVDVVKSCEAYLAKHPYNATAKKEEK